MCTETKSCEAKCEPEAEELGECWECGVELNPMNVGLDGLCQDCQDEVSDLLESLGDEDEEEAK